MEVFSFITLLMGVILTLFVFSFELRENVFYRIAEYTLVGAATGQYVVLAVSLLRTFWNRFGGGSYILILGFILGPLLLATFFRKYSWLSRYATSFLMGAGVGFSTRGLIHADIVNLTMGIIKGPYTQASASILLNSYIMLIGTICIMSYFVFSKDITKGMRGKVLSKLGIAGRFIMFIAFGAAFGNMFQSQIIILLDRVSFVLEAIFH